MLSLVIWLKHFQRFAFMYCKVRDMWLDMWVEFVGSLLCTERFSPGTPVSPLLKNQYLT